jgi:cellobiose-specific phosphotransferase system component IIA
MQTAESFTSIDQRLADLVQILGEERAALIQMNIEEIERSTARKAALNEELLARRNEFSDLHRAQLKAIQTEVRHNLILLVHARDHIQGTLSILTGRPALPGQFHQPKAESVRLDLRG